jgi:hypothetical protein
MSTTSLSGDHVLREVYDPTTQSLKTLVTANISGAQEVIISYVDDSIQVKGATGNALVVNNDGSLNVNGVSTVSGTVTSNIAGLDAFKTTQYTINTSIVQLTPTPLANRSAMTIKCVTSTSVDAVYIGNSSVSTATGYPLFNGDSVQLDLTAVFNIYAVGSSAGQKLYIMELG